MVFACFFYLQKRHAFFISCTCIILNLFLDITSYCENNLTAINFSVLKITLQLKTWHPSYFLFLCFGFWYLWFLYGSMIYWKIKIQNMLPNTLAKVLVLDVFFPKFISYLNQILTDNVFNIYHIVFSALKFSTKTTKTIF